MHAQIAKPCNHHRPQQQNKRKHLFSPFGPVFQKINAVAKRKDCCDTRKQNADSHWGIFFIVTLPCQISQYYYNAIHYRCKKIIRHIEVHPYYVNHSDAVRKVVQAETIQAFTMQIYHYNQRSKSEYQKFPMVFGPFFKFFKHMQQTVS